MLTNFKIADNHKVWVFVASRSISELEQKEILDAGKNFMQSWNAHGAEVKGDLDILINQVIVVKADQSYTQNSGCSIDKLTHFIKGIEQKFGLELLNRMYVPFSENDNWQVAHVTQLKSLNIDRGNSQIMNIMVSDSGDFNHSFIQNMKSSWVSEYIAL
jgi:hypothetical protein